jgi:diguanylate cyclase (GGDEF)-like protein/PAS domain S-box-containing protein
VTDRHDVSGDMVRRAVDQLPSLIGYWTADLRNVFANRVYAQYFGLDPSEIVGMHIQDVLGVAVYEMNLPHITGVLAGEQQQFDRTLIDVDGTVRHTRATYVPDSVDGVVVGFTVLVVDVSDRVEAERQRDRAERLFRVAMENAPIGKAVLTLDGRWLQVNRALCELTGYSVEELQQSTFRDITHPDDIGAAEALLDALVDGSVQQVSSEKRYLRKDGSTIWVQRNATLVRDADTGDVIIAQIQDISARKAAEENLARQASIDDLTGLANRRRLMSELTSPVAAPDKPVGILFIDVDSFKAINDTYGHAAGDEVLVALGRRLSDNTRGTDLACRIGGDEFVILLRSARSSGDVEGLAGRIGALLGGTYDVGGVDIPVTVSVGWSWSPDVGSERLLRDADARMYRAKRG